ncbi:hypothetical protein Hamer_G022061, partial [Homarus americanus]
VTAARLVILSLVCYAAAAQEPAEQTAQETAQGTSEDGTPGEAKFFIKSYSTTTWTILSSLTSTIPYTCYDTGGVVPPACMGRRLRRSRGLSKNVEIQDASDVFTSIDSTLLSEEMESDPDQKFLFTVWRTSRSTATITTFSTNRSVTVSVSIACLYPGIVYNQC